MIIQCDNCRSKFKLDDSRVTGKGVKVRCTKCQNIFVVAPPQAQEGADLLESQPAAPRREEKPQPRKKTEDKKSLSFNFGEEDEQQSSAQGNTPNFTFGGADFNAQEEKAPEPPAPQKSAPHELSEGEDPFNFDFSGSQASVKHEKDEISKHDEFFSDIDFNFGDDDEPAVKEKPAPKDNDDDFSFNADDDIDKNDSSSGFEAKTPETKTADKEESFDPFQAASFQKAATAYSAPLKESGAPGPEETEEDRFEISGAPQKQEEKPAKPETKKPEAQLEFKEVLSETISENPEPPLPTDTTEPAFGAENQYSVLGEDGNEDDEEESAPVKKGKNLKAAIAALIIIIAVAAIYFSGIAGKIASSPAQDTATLEIDAMTGAFVENASFNGKIFYIEAKVKNLTEDFQKVREVKGALFDKSGDKVMESSSAPGRIISVDEMKSLPKEDILKPLNDLSAGLIPPKGTLPVMIVFTDVPESVSEYSLDIVR